MAISVQFDRASHTLIFRDFPLSPIKYREAPDEGELEELQVVDGETIFSVWVEGKDLRSHGISLSTWKSISKSEHLPYVIRLISRIHSCLLASLPLLPEYLKPHHRSFFEDTAFANRAIQRAIHSGQRHYRYPGVPGMYLTSENDALKHIFINLKGTRPLGKGNNAKVREVFSLFDLKIVAKKVFRDDRKQAKGNVEWEMDALQNFQGKTGIISPIAGGCFEDKCALFMPLYKYNSLLTYLCTKPFPFSLDATKSIVLQWLEGLSTIAEKGIHGDIKPLNLLIGKRESGIEAAITDFGAYCSHEKPVWGNTTFSFSPPEYFDERKMVSAKGDVWAMGLCLLGIFSGSRPPFVNLTKEECAAWTRGIPTLPPDWSAAYPLRRGTPPFIQPLLLEMLDIDPDRRPTAAEVFMRFSEGFARGAN